jgi:hypothetical protein
VPDDEILPFSSLAGDNEYSVARAPSLRSYNPQFLLHNQRVCLINQQSNDLSRQFIKPILQKMSENFKNAGFVVDIKNAEDFTLNFLETSVHNYGIVFFKTHGGYIDGLHWILTGEEVNSQNKNEIKNYIGLRSNLGVNEKRENAILNYFSGEKWIGYMSVNENFISNHIHNFSDNSVIFNTACQSLMSGNGLGNAFSDKNAGIYLGFTETQGIGLDAAYSLFEKMLSGTTIETAYNNLASEHKKQVLIENGEQIEAELQYVPISGKSIYLLGKDAVNIIISSPLDGRSYAQRTILLSGKTENNEKIQSGTVEVNGKSYVLDINSIDPSRFEQTIEITSGTNTIKVSCNCLDALGEQLYGVKEIKIENSIEALDLYTALRWDTNYSDVDFHLLPPGADFGDIHPPFSVIPVHFLWLPASWERLTKLHFFS